MYLARLFQLEIDARTPYKWAFMEGRVGKRARMVGWFDPPRLIAIAVRVAVSKLFGEFADRREALAAAREIDPITLDKAYDYRDDHGEGFWLDFVADNGDGWNSTYAIARLLAEPQLIPDGQNVPLPRGSVLVMGGDEVYPTASRDAYKTKLVDPFDEAARGKTWEAPSHVYAIPGNHDWYDGLSSFLGLFCRRRNSDGLTKKRPGRKFGGRETRQTRSYFALRLPQGWWLWGADIQLAGYIDQPQIDFFTHVAGQWMEPGSRLILCTGQPSWTLLDPKNPEPAFKNFSYLESIVTLAGKGHRLCLVLSGDSHHYARYVEGDCQYITSGGGGAFLHPTHHLEEKRFTWDYAKPGSPSAGATGKYPREFLFARNSVGEPALFPDQRTSCRLTWRNLAFAWLNWRYTATLAGICGFFAWLLHAEAWRRGSTLASELGSRVTLADTVLSYLALLGVAPWPIGLVILAFAGYCYMCDFPSYWRLVVGGLHAAVQIGTVMLASCVLARAMHGASDVWLISSIAAVGGTLSATLLGAYLLISLNFFKRHWNEAFSALRIENYKNFLRMCIHPDGGLRIYPVGLKDVPAEPRSGTLRNRRLRPHLIEPVIEVH